MLIIIAYLEKRTNVHIFDDYFFEYTNGLVEFLGRSIAAGCSLGRQKSYRFESQLCIILHSL